MAVDVFDVTPFSADGLYDYINNCGKTFAEKNGIETETIVEKANTLKMKKSHEELVAEVKEMGAKLVKSTAKERVLKITNEVTKDGETKIDDLADGQLEDLITQYTMVASEKGIEL
jgi:uncharacterized protein Yka (UPF0111/DUF47 family)